MTYKVVRNEKYDFIGQSYSTLYPNLHKYPATMLPQIGIELLREFNIKSGNLLDPYCGSGSSFVSGLEVGLNNFNGYDLNPLAVLISKIKLTKLPLKTLEGEIQNLRNNVFEFLKQKNNLESLSIPTITNINFWFSKNVAQHLAILKHFIEHLKDNSLQNFFLVPFSEVVRDCSYTRNNEFKLFRMKEEKILSFNPDVINIFFEKLEEVFLIYKNYYHQKTNHINFEIECRAFKNNNKKFSVVLTSPPYGDSRTTVAYGQFSTLSNEWLGIKEARKLDNSLMGGKRVKENIKSGIMADYISDISKLDNKRALEVSSFYSDLGNSIKEVSNSIERGGKAIYIVGNRRVKNIQLPTDQFIAESFENNGFKHLITYQRLLSNKSMPSKNSPTNKSGKLANTMSNEWIVVCEK